MFDALHIVKLANRRIFEWFHLIKEKLIKAFVTFAVFLLLLWLSVFLYASFHYVYMPAMSHTYPIYLQFKTECEPDQQTLCSFPAANISFTYPGGEPILMPGQPYDINVQMEMPESEVNQKLGMFMIVVHLYTKHGQVVQTSARSAMLHYKSTLLRYLYTLSYSLFLILDQMKEEQIQSVEVFHNYLEDAYRPALGAYIEIQSKRIEIYSAFLIIHAHFTGLRYLLFRFPVTSAIAGISFNMMMLSVIALLSWYQYLWKQDQQQTVIRIDYDPSLERRRIAARERLVSERGRFSVPTRLNSLATSTERVPSIQVHKEDDESSSEASAAESHIKFDISDQRNDDKNHGSVELLSTEKIPPSNRVRHRRTPTL